MLHAKSINIFSVKELVGDIVFDLTKNCYKGEGGSMISNTKIIFDCKKQLLWEKNGRILTLIQHFITVRKTMISHDFLYSDIT